MTATMTSETASKPAAVAIIGFGKMGIFHSALTNAHPNANVVAVVDKDSRLPGFLHRFNESIATYSTVNDLLGKKQLDAAIITTPANTHALLMKEFSGSDLKLFVEKPLDISCANVAAAQLSPSVRDAASVGYVMRFYSTFAKAKALLDSNAIGPVRSYSAEYYITAATKPLKGWRADPSIAGGGALITNASHVLDLCLWYFGVPQAVNGVGQHYIHRNVEDAFHAILHHDNLPLGCLSCSWSRENHRKPYMRLEMIGERGELEVDTDQVQLILFEDTNELPRGVHRFSSTDLYSGEFFDLGGTEFSRQTDAFLGSLGGTPSSTLCTFDEAFAVQQTIDALYESARSNGSPAAIEGIKRERQ